jgi:hypothetical protein
MAGMTNELRQVKVDEVRSVRETFDWLQATGKAVEAAAYDAVNGKIPEGAHVSCRFNDTSDWVGGVVEKDHGDGTYDVVLDDGERQEGKARVDLKPERDEEEEVMAPLPALSYFRIPITDETPPEEKDFDDIIAMFRSFECSGPNAFMVFNCQMGRGRTTTAMVAASILWYATRGWTMEKMVYVDPDAPDLAQGEWKGVIGLLSALDDGLEVKALVDQCVDECAHCQNLREAIKDCKDQASSAPSSGERSSAFWLKRGQNYLERYSYLLLFAAYAHAQAPSGFSQTFSTWMRGQWNLKRVLKSLVLD